jgi:class 3 adenylate cyclase
MTTQEVKRKLAAILSADVKGYSRLMGEDEKGTGGKGSRIPGFKGPSVL